MADDSLDTSVFREINGDRLVEIRDRHAARSLYFGGKYLQSRMAMHSPHTLLLPYTHYMMFALLLLDKLERILLIGLGAGSLVRFLHHHFPGCAIDAVDNSELIIKLARGYFQLPTSNRIRIYCQDGEPFLADPALRSAYDLILLDAFDEAGMAAHIYAAPFFLRCRQALQPQGILCCNLWSGGPKTAAAIATELGSAFPDRLLLPVPERGNVICQAGARAVQWRRICRQRHELHHFQDRFGLDFPRMVRVAMRHNMGFVQRLLYFLSS